jgi:hypothetical protein
LLAGFGFDKSQNILEIPEHRGTARERTPPTCRSSIACLGDKEEASTAPG